MSTYDDMSFYLIRLLQNPMPLGRRHMTLLLPLSECVWYLFYQSLIKQCSACHGITLVFSSPGLQVATFVIEPYLLVEPKHGRRGNCCRWKVNGRMEYDG